MLDRLGCDRINHDLVVVGAVMLRGATRVLPFAERLVGVSDGECRKGLGGRLASERQHRRGVESSREKHPQGHVRHQSLFDRFTEELSNRADTLILREVLRLELEVPVRLNVELPVTHDQSMPRRQLVDAAEHRGGCRHELVSNVMVERLQVDLAWHELRGEHALDLRAEDEAGAVPAVVERLDAQSVAGQHQRPLRGVPDRKTELSVEPVDALLAMLLPLVDDDLGVAAGSELVTASGERGAASLVIVDFSVERDPAEPSSFESGW